MFAATPITEIVDRFHDEGFVILPGFLEPKVLANVRRDVQTVADLHIRRLLAEGKITRSNESKPFETRLIHVYQDYLARAAPATHQGLYRR